MAKKNKRADDDTTIDNGAAAEPEEDLEPGPFPETPEEPTRGEAPEGGSSPGPTPVESASGAPVPPEGSAMQVQTDTPGPTPVESASGAPVPPERSAMQVQTDELAQDVKRGRLREYVRNRGLLTPGQVENASDEELQAIYEASIAMNDPPAIAPTTLVQQTPSAIAQQVLTSSSREQKVQLLVEQAGLAPQQAESLTLEELDLQVRAVVLSAIATEAQQKEAAAYQIQPVSDAPYGGNPPKYYVVTKGQKYAHDGQVIEVKPGETVNDRSHDIETLRRFGIVLHEIVAPDPSSPL